MYKRQEDAIILDDAGLRSALEAVLLVVDTPVSVEELATATDPVSYTHLTLPTSDLV